MTVERALAVVLRDAPFYRRSGGGVTLGGGEPTGQPEFARSLLEACRRHDLDTAMETCGHAETRSFLSVAAAADLYQEVFGRFKGLTQRLATGGYL